MPTGEKTKELWKNPEFWKKLVELRLGKPSGMKGKHHSVETKAKMSIKSSQRKHTDSARLKISLAKRGDKSHFWKGGITEKNMIIRESIEYKLWREAVFKRDRFTCIWCGHKSKGLRPSDIHADHIKPFSLFPELRFSIDNGRTLCVECHKKTDTWGWKLFNKENYGK